MLIGLGAGQFTFGKQNISLFGKPLPPRSISLWSARMRSRILCTSLSMLKKAVAESAMRFAVWSGFPTLSNSARAFLAASR